MHTGVVICLVMWRISGGYSQEIIDLTHDLKSDNVFWPGSPSFTFNIMRREQTDSFWYETNKYSTAEHVGTHLDAPAHFAKGKWRVHDIPLRHLIGPGVVIDITARARNDPDAQVEIDDLLKWEYTYGNIPDKAIVVMKSGWSAKWLNASAVFGTVNATDPSTFHFPGFSPLAAKWLVDNRNYINALGVDTPSTDYGQSRLFQTHVAISMANVVGLENMANLDQVPLAGSTIFAIPLKLYDGSGSQSRIFAMTEFSLVCSASNICNYFNVFFLPFVVFYHLF